MIIIMIIMIIIMIRIKGTVHNFSDNCHLTEFNENNNNLNNDRGEERPEILLPVPRYY